MANFAKRCLSVLVLVMAGLAVPAAADDPGWHNGKVRALWVGTAGIRVSMEPSLVEPCGSDFPFLHRDPCEDDCRKYHDRAFVILTEAMHSQSNVGVFLKENFSSNGNRYCTILIAQGWKPPAQASGSNTGSNTGGGGGGDGDGDVPSNRRHVAIAHNTRDDGSLGNINASHGSTAARARSHALDTCRERASYNPETCQILSGPNGDVVYPRAHIGKPYCWAFARSPDRRYWGAWHYANAPGSYLARTENEAIASCGRAGGSGCTIPSGFSGCIGVSGSVAPMVVQDLP